MPGAVPIVLRPPGYGSTFSDDSLLARATLLRTRKTGSPLTGTSKTPSCAEPAK